MTLEVPDRTTVGQIMASLHVPDDLDRLQVVNGHDAVPEHILKDGDVLSAFPPLAGGASSPRPAGSAPRYMSGTSRSKIMNADRRVASSASRICASPSPAPLSRRDSKNPV